MKYASSISTPPGPIAQDHVRFVHQFANLSEHAPRALVGDSGLALNLFGRNAATGRTHQVHGVKPDSQFGARLLKDRPGQRVDVVPAGLTSVGRPAMHAVVFSRFVLALAAVGHSAGKTLLFDLLKAGVIVREIFVELLEGVAEFGGDCLASIHGKNSLPDVLLVVTG